MSIELREQSLIPARWAPRSQGCRFCAAPLSHAVVDLGMSPLCESFLRPSASTQMEPFYPLHVAGLRAMLPRPAARVRRTRGDLHRVRLLLVVLGQLGRARARLRRVDAIDALQLGPRRASWSSSPATTATCCSTSSSGGIPALGVEPARERRRGRRGERGDRTAGRVLRPRSSRRELVADGRQADLMVAQQHARPRARTSTTSSAGMRTAARARRRAHDRVPAPLRLLEDNQFDTIYHEHFSYFSLATARSDHRGPRPDGRRRRGAADARRLAARLRPHTARPRRQPAARRRAARARARAGLDGLAHVRGVRRAGRGDQEAACSSS